MVGAVLPFTGWICHILYELFKGDACLSSWQLEQTTEPEHNHMEICAYFEKG